MKDTFLSIARRISPLGPPKQGDIWTADAAVNVEEVVCLAKDLLRLVTPCVFFA